MCLYYQTVSNSYLYLQLVTLFFITLVLIFVLTQLNESPKYLYSKGQFDDARDSLRMMAKFNGVVYDDNFTFDTEDQEIKNNIPSNDQVIKNND